MRLPALLCVVLLAAGCGSSVTREEAAAVFSAALDGWEAEVRASPDTTAPRLADHLDRAAREKGHKSWKAFTTKAVASMGQPAWDRQWEAFSLALQARMEKVMKETAEEPEEGN